MATFAQISEVRLKINDPADAIEFVEVANQAAIPDPPISQRGYKTTDTGLYYVSDSVNSASLYVSDTSISGWIDEKNEEYAVYKSIQQIIARIGRELRIESVKTGTEDIKYTDLKKMMDYYEWLLEGAKNDYEGTQGNNSGRVGQTDQPEVAGGNL